MAQQKKNTALAVMNDFQIVSRYDGMTPEEREELQDQLEDLDQESGIACRKSKSPAAAARPTRSRGTTTTTRTP